MLLSLHVDAVKLFHQLHGILVDLRLGFRPRRIALKHISREVTPQRFRDLAERR